MPLASRARRAPQTDLIWPGFVDALSTLLMVIIFLLVVFMLAQYFLSVTLSGRDETLDRLSRQVSELASLLSLERQANADLRLDIAQLSAELQTSTATRDSLSSQLATTVSELDALDLRLARMTDQAAQAEANTEAVRAALAEANETISVDRETLELKLAELASLKRDIAALRQVRTELETQVAQLALALDETTLSLEERKLTVDVTSTQLTMARDRSMELEARLANETERTALAQKEIEDREIRLEELRLALQQSDAELLGAQALSSAALAEANETISVDRETLEVKLAELASLKRDIATLRQVRTELETQVAQLALALDETTLSLEERKLTVDVTSTQLTMARDRSMKLEARLANETDRTALAQKEIEDREIRLEELRLALQQSDVELLGARALSSTALAQVALLNQQIIALRLQLERLSAALDIAEAEAEAQGAVIADLGRKLNLALAGKVEELQRYRSEFFGRLHEVLGNRPGIRVVDDRFVFQAEVLFGSGSATFEAAGREQMTQLARTLLDIARDIPLDIPWILRVDGHTDRIPISTALFTSNWELSSARAISVVRFLVSQGVPPERLVAAGFGEFQPIDPNDDEIAYRRNRRIELKLTSR